MENNFTDNKIFFAHHLDADKFRQACVIERYTNEGVSLIAIQNGVDYPDYESVNVNSKKHAKALIKALNQAIKNGWLE